MYGNFRLNTNPERANSRYFKKTRTQPFIITFFMAVLAFKKIFKIMRRKFSQKRVAATTRRRSTFLSAVKRSNHSMSFLFQGKALIHSLPKDTESIDENEIGENDTEEDLTEPDAAVAAVVVAKSKSVHFLRYQKAEEISQQVTKTLERYYARLRAQTRAIPLTEKLDAAAKLNQDSPQKRRQTSANALASVDLPASTGNALQDWNNMQQAMQAAQQPDAQAILEKNLQHAANDIGEYLEGTPIYYGATLALQARHGGYLSYATGDVKASAHKVMSQSRFIVKKSDDLTDIGAVKFGDALWLQTISNGGMAPNVLGAVYGSLVDKKREIQPALVSCKRSNMAKAQQYGRWIILNRDDPVGTLGKPVNHLNRIILEQEWCFLASNSPYSSSMFRICENSDDALARKIDLFRPGEECVWRLHLVALPSDDGEYEKQRQQRLQEAKDQIDASEELRLKKSNFLLSSLVSFLPPSLRDDNYIKEKMQHKASAASEQDYLLAKYRDMESRDFRPMRENVEFLERVYGPDSSIVAYRREAHRINNREHDTSPHRKRRQQQARQGARSVSPSIDRKSKKTGKLAVDTAADATQGGGSSPTDELTAWQILHQVSNQTKKLENFYWDTAQRLLVDSRSYDLMPAVMEEFMDKDRNRKQQAARVIQAFIRRCLDRCFNFHRQFRRVDKLTRSRLEAKLMLKRRLLLDAGGGNPTGKAPDASVLADAVQSSTTIGEVNHNILWKAVNRFKEAGATYQRNNNSSSSNAVFAQEMQANQLSLQKDIAEQHAKIAHAEEMEAKKLQQQQELQLLHQQQHDAIAKLRKPNMHSHKPRVSSSTSIFTTQMNLDGTGSSSNKPANANTNNAASHNNKANGQLTAQQQQVAYFQEQYEKYLRKKQHQLLSRKESFIAMSPAALNSAIPAQQAFFSQTLFEHVHAKLMEQQGLTPQQIQQQKLQQQQLQQQLFQAANGHSNTLTGASSSQIDAQLMASQMSFGTGLHHSSQPVASTPIRRTFNTIDSQLYPSATTRHLHPADQLALSQATQLPMTTQRLLYDPGLLRPATAPSKYEIAVTHEINPRLTKDETVRESQQLKDALGVKAGRGYGLPDDVFEDIKGPTSIKTGVKFLKAMSRNQSKSMPSIPVLKTHGENLFGDLKVKKKRSHNHHHRHNSQHQQVESERKSRPQSSNAAIRRRGAERIL